MTTYTNFVKQAMRQLDGTNLTSQQKMKKIGAEWRRQTGSVKSGAKKATRKVKKTVGGTMSLRGGSAGRSRGRKNTSHVHLDNGVPLHPDMLGGGRFWRGFKKGFQMPFQAVNEVAQSPMGKTAMMAAPFLL